MTSDATIHRATVTIMSPVAILYIDGGACIGMVHHLSMGPADGVHVNTFETQEVHAMPEALGFVGSCIYMPFVFRFRLVVEGINHISAMVERFEELSECAVSCILEDDLVVGWCSTTDSSDGTAAFGRRCMDALAALESDGIYVVHGRVALDTMTLVDGFAVLHDIANHELAHGRVVSTMSASVDRSVASSDMDKTMHMLVVQTIGFEVVISPLLLDTLCARFDDFDSKTGAYEWLGIRRQVLYNRPDKVTQVVGVGYNDKPDWSTLLFAVRLIKPWQERRGE